jgi:probable phosphomutase (TIGR03848 family)
MSYTSNMLLLLVRHGATSMTGKKLTGWLPGFSLSEEGKRQSEKTAKRLADLSLKAIYSSPLERCLETAQVIAIPHKREVQVIENLGEIRYGDWQGRSLKSLYRTKAWRELRARPGDFRFPNGETIREAQVRGMAEIEKLRKRHKGHTIVVCSHADMIRVLVAGYLGLALDLYNRMSIAPASVTAIAMDEIGVRLLRLSDTGNLSELGEPARKVVKK